MGTSDLLKEQWWHRWKLGRLAVKGKWRRGRELRHCLKRSHSSNPVRVDTALNLPGWLRSRGELTYMYMSDQFCPKMSLHYDRKYWDVLTDIPSGLYSVEKLPQKKKKRENKEILKNVVFKWCFLPFRSPNDYDRHYLGEAAGVPLRTLSSRASPAYFWSLCLCLEEFLHIGHGCWEVVKRAYSRGSSFRM